MTVVALGQQIFTAENSGQARGWHKVTVNFYRW